MSLHDLFDDAPVTGSLTILTVCTGNICRSPLAEALLRHHLDGLPVTVHSAGTYALAGEQMTDQNQVIASELGVDDARGHRARQLTEPMLDEADLVLALSREHRRAIAELLPRANRVTFTLREFARLTRELSLEDEIESSPTDAGARMRQLVASIAQLRGSVAPPTDAEDDDVVDPYRRSDEVYAASASQIIPAIEATAFALRRAAEQQG